MALHKGLRIAVAFGIFIGALGAVYRPALAACTSPAGIAGGMTWNGTDSVIWCDGTNWYTLKNSGASGTAGYIQFSNGSGGFSSSGTTAGQQLFWDDTNKRLGIGTATPSTKLEVFAVSTAYAKLKTFTSTAANRSAVLLGRSRSTTVGTAQHVLSGDAIGSFLGVSDNGGSESWVGMNVVATEDHTDTAHGMALTFTTTSNNSVSAPERMRIDNNGYVGIGTTSPPYNLSLNENAAQTIGMGRTTAANGYGLTVSAGDAKAATTDRNGGSLVLSSGIATGTGSSNIYFRTAAPQASTNTTDNTPTDKMTILGSGYVGIGTASPGYKLHLFDSVGGAEATLLQLHNRSGSNGTAAGIAFSPSMNASTDLRIVGTQFGNSDTRFQFYTYGPDGSVQRMILHYGGLGIGPATSNLGAQLDLNGDRSSGAWTRYGIGLRIRGGPYTDTSSSGTVATNIINSIYGGTTLAATNATTYTRAATFGIGGAPSAGTNVTLTSPLAFLVEAGKSAFNGNVGIFVDGPSYALSFGGEAARTIGVERPTTATNGLGLTINAGGAQSGGTDLNGGNLTLTAGTSTGAGSSNMYFQTATAGATATTDRAPTTKMTILGSGNVGIGTTTPANTLSVLGNTVLSDSSGTFANGNYVLRIYSAASMYSLNSYYSNADTNGPRYIFQKHKGVGVELAVGDFTGEIDFNGTSAAGNALPAAAIASAADTGWGGVADSPGRLMFYTTPDGSGSLAERMRITNAGNVGIGTTTPAAKLDVNGFMRLAKNGSAPATCDATIDGSIALTSQYTLCACKGGSAAWVRTTDGTTACTW